MNADKDYYVAWKAEKDVRARQPRFAQSRDFSSSAAKFYGATAEDDLHHPVITAHQQAKETAKAEIQARTDHLFSRPNDWYNPDKTQAGVFYDDAGGFEGLSEDQRMDIERKSHASNGIFRPTTYSSVSDMQDEWKQRLGKSTTQADHNPEQFKGLEPDLKFNLRRTPISEYSNALHNNTVFINPRFTSC